MRNSQPIHIVKNEKVCAGENTEGVSAQSFDKEIMGLISHLSRNKNKDGVLPEPEETLPAWTKGDKDRAK